MCTYGYAMLSTAAVERKNISDLIAVDIFQAQVAETLQKPISAGILAKRWSRHTRQCHLPPSEFCLAAAQP
jgi:hypothetical protein